MTPVEVVLIVSPKVISLPAEALIFNTELLIILESTLVSVKVNVPLDRFTK